MKTIIRAMLLPLFVSMIACTSPQTDTSEEKIREKAEEAEQSNQNKRAIFGIEATRPVNLNTARAMISEYSKHPGRMQTRCIKGDDTTFVPLIGFRIEIDTLKKIMALPDVKELFIVPAVRDSDQVLNSKDQLFTFIIAGIDKNNTIVTNPLLDYCDPCPSHCPAKLSELGLSVAECK